MSQPKSNKFCKLKNLQNESDVEQFLVVPLLASLGYEADYLETKATVNEVSIGKGKKKKGYVPDYLAYTTRTKTKPVLIIDAKHPNESALDGVYDAQLYASSIRRQMKEPKPEQYCMGINGRRLIVKHYDSNTVLHSLAFHDIVDGNPSFKALCSSIGRVSLSKSVAEGKKCDFDFRSVEPVELPAIFEACHRSIWKAEKRSPASAFYEFAKVMFVKIDEDRRLHEYLSANSIDLGGGSVPTEAVRFSVKWIEQMESTTDNPIDTILFAQLSKQLNLQIDKGEKKRIFDRGEGIELAPTTVKEAVLFLEHLDLYAVDEDLNGRLFETFLTATMRGSALGQYFTPRSVVKFMVQLAKLRASKTTMGLILDGCCGTGGFLIEAMADMTSKINRSKSITKSEKEALLQRLRQETLWGIDAGKDPQMARIARLNMLLHKDGGSRIYFADGLDKHLRIERGLPNQIELERDELRTALANKETTFSCILSNPPFAMTYERKKQNEEKKQKEQDVLIDYELATKKDGKPRASLRSSVMFLERYYDLLTDNQSALGAGRLITIMDESVLNTLTSQPFREYILNNFILRAVIALPRNTFVKAQGSVKTSVLYLRKKIDPLEPQADVFMALCRNVGHSDSGKERPHLNTLPNILKSFEHFEDSGHLQDETLDSVFLVQDISLNNPTMRLDAHYFDPHYFDTMATLTDFSFKRGWSIKPLKSLLRKSKTSLAGGATPRGAVYPDEGPKFVRVQNVKPMRLEWSLESDPCIGLRTHAMLRRSQLQESDVVLTITGTYGVAAVVPKGFPPANINQHSVKIEVTEEIMPEYLCLFLNSDLCRPQFDRAVTGSSRLALDYQAIKALKILYPPNKEEQKRLVDIAVRKLHKSVSLRHEADQLSDALTHVLTTTP